MVLEFKVDNLWQKGFMLLYGMFIGISLLKFGNPCLFDKFIPMPENIFEWVINSWPVKIGYWLLGILAVVGLFTLRLRKFKPRWLLVAPIMWLGWQFISATQTIDAELTRVTLFHFVACVACFYLGFFCITRGHALLFWLPILGAMLVVIGRGFEQHFGGLEETRRFFWSYIYPKLDSVPEEYLKKISSDRIFSTLFYPNALAGAILLLLPPTALALWQVSKRLTLPVRSCITSAYGMAALACLIWSGSKGGWLLALFGGLVTVLRVPISMRFKGILVALIVFAGGIGFLLRHSAFFEHGATSVHARFDYWRAAGQTIAAKPILGSGPGTFGEAYKAVKKPESEMARLAHNDYLQQASDSGLLGGAIYIVWICGMGYLGYLNANSGNNRTGFFAWLGVLGWVLQGITEFGLYIPALAWTAFSLAGALCGKGVAGIDVR